LDLISISFFFFFLKIATSFALDVPTVPLGCRPNSNVDDSADAPNYDMEDSDDELDPLTGDPVDDDDDDDGDDDVLDDLDSPSP
jgi:hypothetical protein